MIRYQARLVAFLNPVLMLTLVVSRSPASARTENLPPVTNAFDRFPDAAWAILPTMGAVDPFANPLAPLSDARRATLPTMRAVDLKELRLLARPRAESDRPVLREREAVLPNPLNGRQLVDQVLVQRVTGRPIPVQATTVAGPQSVSHLRRLAPNFQVPVTLGRQG